MYMYEENFKRNNEDITLSDAVANASGVVPESYLNKETKGNVSAQPMEPMAMPQANMEPAGLYTSKPGLTIKNACIIAAAILVVSGIAVFCILHGGGVI